MRVVCVSLCGEALARRGFREKRFHLAVCFFFFLFLFFRRSRPFDPPAIGIFVTWHRVRPPTTTLR